MQTPDIRTFLPILTQDDHEESLRQLIDWTKLWIKDDDIGIYFLSTRRSAYLLVPRTTTGWRESRPYSEEIQKKKIITAKRGDLVIAYLCWKQNDPEQLEPYSTLISIALISIHLQIFTNNYFKHIRKPIDYQGIDNKNYYKDTAILLSKALSMEIVAWRSFNEESKDLETIIIVEKNQEIEKNKGDFDFINKKMPPSFAEAISRAKQKIESDINKNNDKEYILKPLFEEKVNMNDKRYFFLQFGGEKLSKVQTFVIFPVIIEDKLFGIISCATTIPYIFSKKEKEIFSATMQLVGVAASNYIQFQESTLLRERKEETLANITAIEVAQSVKHELLNDHLYLRMCYDGLKNKPQFHDIKTAIDGIGLSIKKFEYVFSNNLVNKTNTEVKTIWESACDLITHRIMDIKVIYIGDSLKGTYHKDALRNIFLNLLLNSIDAFQYQRKSNRKITLNSIQQQSDKCVLDYSDNAGGIHQHFLTIPKNIQYTHPGIDITQLIFLPQVTRKRKSAKLGSGWGLFLVRRYTDLHQGSINLIKNDNNGCTFRIDLKNIF